MKKGFWPALKNKDVLQARQKENALRGYDCESCGLYRGCITPKMSPTGEGRLKVLIVAEASGKNEDEEGVQLIGDAGQLFRRKLEPLDLDLDRDFWKTNAVNCRPPNNREPTAKELKCCRPRLMKAIKDLKPDMIWLMGGVALESFFLGRDFDNLQITTWRKFCIPDQETGTWIVPLLHPSFMLRNDGNKNIESVYDRDLKWAASQTGKPFPSYGKIFENRVECITDFNRLSTVLNEVESAGEIPFFFFDYETTGIRPFRAGHKIASISFCYGKDRAYSFPFEYPGVWNKKQADVIFTKWHDILRSAKIGKAAQNLKFEELWTRIILGTSVENWVWDTMQATHILDDRQGITSLKFQVFARWGIYGYDSLMEKYIEDAGKSGFNRVMEAPLGELLKYGGLDSLFGFMLLQEQKREYALKSNAPLQKAYDLWHEGCLAFVDMEEEGIPVDMKYYKKEDARLGEEIRKIKERMQTGEWIELFKSNTGRDMDFGSSKDLGVLLFDLMKIPSDKKTAKGNRSVDQAALEAMEGRVPFVKDLLRLRKLEKIKGTYLAQFMREEVGGKIRPSFNLHLNRGFRGSCDHPNFQNIPVRDEEAMKSTRGGIVPSPGNKIMEVDFKGIEVCMAPIYTKDPEMIRYVSDPKTDMHRDQANKLFFLDGIKGNWKESPLKEIRFHTKNGWTFPEFYGSWYAECAKNLWEVMSELNLPDGTPLKIWMGKNGILNYPRFESHLESCENDFWDQFKVYAQWKEDIQNFFQKRGYVQMYFGHRSGGVLKKNEITNRPFQGTAFHCLLWTLIRVNRARIKRGWESKICGQIHDSIFFDLFPDEEKVIRKLIQDLVGEEIRKENPWINVPLTVEVELTGVDQPWSMKRPV